MPPPKPLWLTHGARAGRSLPDVLWVPMVAVMLLHSPARAADPTERDGARTVRCLDRAHQPQSPCLDAWYDRDTGTLHVRRDELAGVDALHLTTPADP